jgi:hypothetical protein
MTMKKAPANWDYFHGAGEETQTLDLFLGKEALYQLSYTRITLSIIRGSGRFFKSFVYSLRGDAECTDYKAHH